MLAACVAPVLPTADWRARADHGGLLRSGLVLALVVALHVGATFFLGNAGARLPVAPRPGPVVTTLWLLPEDSDKISASITPAKLASARKKAAVKPALARPAEAASQLERDLPAADAKTDQAPLIAATTVREPEYQVARRSLVFGGGAATHDDAVPARNTTRQLDGWLQDGIARSVWPVATELSVAGEGICRVTHDDVRFVCAGDTFDAALSRIPDDALRSLVTWVRSGLVQEIEIQFERGTARYSVR
jgi:hypothetical protein